MANDPDPILNACERYLAYDAEVYKDGDAKSLERKQKIQDYMEARREILKIALEPGIYINPLEATEKLKSARERLREARRGMDEITTESLRRLCYVQRLVFGIELYPDLDIGQFLPGL